MSWSRKARRILVALVFTAAPAPALPSPAGAQVAIVTLKGEPVVGSTLTAVPLPDDDETAIEYRWHRCATELRASCVRIGETATGPSYTVAATDVGHRLAVRAVYRIAGVELGAWSALTGVVPPPPPPPPAPPATVDRPALSMAATPPRFLRPFPVVRVKGRLYDGGARISLLRVTAPSAATVDVRCDGPRCHLRRRSTGSGRITALERFLRAGTRITIRVFRRGAVGKYVRLVIRDGSAPWRRDACLVPGSAKPAQCPPA